MAEAKTKEQKEAEKALAEAKNKVEKQSKGFNPFQGKDLQFSFLDSYIGKGGTGYFYEKGETLRPFVNLEIAGQNVTADLEHITSFEYTINGDDSIPTGEVKITLFDQTITYIESLLRYACVTSAPIYVSFGWWSGDTLEEQQQVSGKLRIILTNITFDMGNMGAIIHIVGAASVVKEWTVSRVGRKFKFKDELAATQKLFNWATNPGNKAQKLTDEQIDFLENNITLTNDWAKRNPPATVVEESESGEVVEKPNTEELLIMGNRLLASETLRRYITTELKSAGVNNVRVVIDASITMPEGDVEVDLTNLALREAIEAILSKCQTESALSVMMDPKTDGKWDCTIRIVDIVEQDKKEKRAGEYNKTQTAPTSASNSTTTASGASQVQQAKMHHIFTTMYFPAVETSVISFAPAYNLWFNWFQGYRGQYPDPTPEKNIDEKIKDAIDPTDEDIAGIYNLYKAEKQGEKNYAPITASSRQDFLSKVSKVKKETRLKMVDAEIEILGEPKMDGVGWIGKRFGFVYNETDKRSFLNKERVEDNFTLTTGEWEMMAVKTGWPDGISVSPFTGVWALKSIKHEIKAQSGFTTTLSVYKVA